MNRVCSIPGCSNKHQARGWCAAHYRRWKVKGDPEPDIPLKQYMWGEDPITRFRSCVDTSAGLKGCHLWTAARDPHGYGRFRTEDATVLAHRWILGFLRGVPLGEGEHACHHCDNPPCVNQAHLYIGTHTDNMQDICRSVDGHYNTRKTYCPNGHPYSGDNLYVNPSGSRVCRTCVRDQRRKREQQQRQRSRS